MNDKTGGPAFPGEQQALLIKSEHKEIAQQYKHYCNGMTLRDYFAAKAMQAMLASPELMVVVTADQVLGENAKQRISNLSYQYADALLKAREQ